MAASAKLSSRYRVTIPKEVRERFGLKPGQRVILTPRNGSLLLEPVHPIEAVSEITMNSNPLGDRKLAEKD